MTAHDVNADVLLPCPFCGGEAVLFDLEHDTAGTYWKVCCNANADDCPADACSVDKPTREEAVAAWNTRAANADLAGEVRELVEDWRTAADAHAEIGYPACADVGRRCADELSAALAKLHPTHQEKP